MQGVKINLPRRHFQLSRSRADKRDIQDSFYTCRSRGRLGTRVEIMAQDFLTGDAASRISHTLGILLDDVLL